MEDMKFNVEKLKQMSRPMTDEEKKDIEFRKENREWLAVSERLAIEVTPYSPELKASSKVNWPNGWE